MAAGDVRLLVGDCLELLDTIEFADAIVTDPPYCSGAFSESGRASAKHQGLRTETAKRLGWFVGDNMGTAGLTFILRAVAFRATQILPPQGSMLTFCDWRMVPVLAPAIESAGLRFQNLVVWDKGNMGLGSGFRSTHEVILHHTNGAPAYHSKSVGNVIRSSRVSRDDREHQTQKPVDLLEKLLSVVCPPNGIVLDPFAGSASTGVAALQTGRRFIGIERDEEYAAVARRRLGLDLA